MNILFTAPTPPNQRFKLLSTKQLAETEAMTSQRTIDGLNAVPVNAREKADCSKILSPQELHQVVIGEAKGDVQKYHHFTKNIFYAIIYVRV